MPSKLASKTRRVSSLVTRRSTARSNSTFASPAATSSGSRHSSDGRVFGGAERDAVAFSTLRAAAVGLYMGKLVVLMFTAFVDMIGSSMILPLVPYYATRMG